MGYLGGYSQGVLELFLNGGVRPQGLKPLPISKDFSPSKIADLTVFFFLLKFFANLDPLKSFSYLKNGWSHNFFWNFYEMGPFSQDFFVIKIGPMSKRFLVRK